MPRYIAFILGCLLFLSSCSSRGSEQGAIPVISPDMQAQGVLSTDSVWNKSEAVFLETTPESVLSNHLLRVVLWDNRIYILDNSKKICIFDRSGRFLKSIRRLGRGPGEYIGLLDFLVDPVKRELILWADVPGKLIHLDMDGAYLYDTALPEGTLFLEMALDKDRIFVVNWGSREYFLSMLDRGKDYAKTDLPMRQSSVPIEAYPPGRLMMQTERLNFTRRFDNTIYSLDDGKIVPRYRMDFGTHNFPNHLMKKNLTQEEAMELPEGTIFSMASITEWGDRMYFSTNGLGIFEINKGAETASYYRLIQDRKRGVFFDRMMSLECIGLPEIGFQQSIPVLKMLADNSKMDSSFRRRVLNSQEDDNLVLFLYSIDRP